MNKLKLMFTATAVFAIVGTSLALNAKRFGTGTLHCKISPAAACSQTKDFVPGTQLSRYCGATPQACINNTTQQILVNQVAL